MFDFKLFKGNALKQAINEARAMSNRITEKDLERLAERINQLTNSPIKSYVFDQGRRHYVAQIGNYHISYQYGGVALHRMHNDGGGIVSVFGCGHVTKRELAQQMQAFIVGMELKRGNV